MSLAQKAFDLYSFLVENLHLKPAEFILKYKSKFDGDIQFAASQLNGLQRAYKKLPTWFKNKRVIYPPNLNLEQSSSELTAEYKGQFFIGKTSSVDLTGGFGVDSFYISKQVERHTYIEPNQELFEVVAMNFGQMDCKNIHCINSTAEDWLGNQNERTVVIYIDPSRRVNGQRKFILNDCVPNIVELQSELLSRAESVIIKLSPLADISLLLRELNSVAQVHIIAVKNECKEVIVVLEKEINSEPKIVAINYKSLTNKEIFTFGQSEEKGSNCDFSKVQEYIYEPNVAILKSGAFKLVAERFRLRKLHPNTHLYTSDELKDGFQGRVYQVSEEKFKKANIISRNHPMKPNELAKKFKLKVGASKEFLLAFRDIEKPKVLFAKRIN